MLFRFGISKMGMAAILLSLIVSPPVVQAQQNALWDKIAASGELNCGVLTDYAPASWQVPATGGFEGYVVNFCRAIAEDLSKAMSKPIVPKLLTTTWSTMVLDAQSGRIDLASGLSVTEERLKAIDMPGPAYILADVLLYRKGFSPPKTWAEFNKSWVRVASVTGTSPEKTAKEMMPNAEHLSFKQRPEMILAMQSGRADVSVSAFVGALSAMKEGANVFGGFVVPEPRKELPSSFGLRKDGDGRMNKWLQAWAENARSSGRVQELIRDALRKAGLDVSDLSGLGK